MPTTAPTPTDSSTSSTPSSPEGTSAPQEPHPTSAAPRRTRSRLNAFRHGLTGHKFVFSPEQADIFQAHYTQILNHYQPRGPIEEALVRQIANGIWSLDRASAIEHSIFAQSFDADPDDDGLALGRTWLAEGKSLALLTLYVKRIEHKLDANKAELMMMQNIRKEEEAQAAEAAARARHYAAVRSDSRNQPAPTPIPDFVFSTPRLSPQDTAPAPVRTPQNEPLPDAA